jgi:tyrosyl-tRNA synthetase
LNTSDADAEKYIKIFTVLSIETVSQLIEEHQQAPHLRQLQKVLAKEVTCMVHSESDYLIAVEASEILFGKGTEETLRKLDEATFLSVFEGVPQFEISRSELEAGINIIDLLAEKSAVFPSKGEARRTIAGGGVAVNKVKVEGPDEVVKSDMLIGGKYLLVQKGKKNYFLLIAG